MIKLCGRSRVVQAWLERDRAEENVASEALDGYLKAKSCVREMTAAGNAADEVLASSHLTDDLAHTANFLKGRALQTARDDNGALAHYRKMIDARTRDAAEARYQIVSDPVQAEQTERGREGSVRVLRKEPAVRVLDGKGLSDSRRHLRRRTNAFQAKATYKVIVDGYSRQE